MKVYYIDPQSYNNLSLYDYSLLSNVKGHQLRYYYSDLYQLQALPCDDCRCVFHYSNKRNNLLKALSYCMSMLRILIDVVSCRPDVVHVQWLRLWHVDYAFAWILRKIGIRVVFTAHNILPHVQRASDPKNYRKYYALVDRIIVHNSRTRDELAEQMQVERTKISVLFHGVFENFVDESAVGKRREALAQQLEIRPGQIVFACLGVQKPYKGTQEVVEVWASTPELRDNPDARLLIIGRNHGLDYTPLQACRNAYVLNEMVDDVDFEAYLELSSVVMLTYRRISQSGLLFSAVHRNVPVLVSDVGGLTEALAIGHIGWNIGSLSVEALREAMCRLVKNPDEIAQVRADKAEFDKICAAYDWRNIGTQTSEFYASLR